MNKGWQRENINAFSQHWSGITLLIDPANNAGEKDYQKNYRKEIFNKVKWVSILTFCLISISIVILHSINNSPFQENWHIYGLLLVKITGIFICVRLALNVYELNSDYRSTVCKVNGYIDCESVLNSKASKLFQLVSWIDIGIIYFCGGFIVTLIYLIKPSLTVLQPLVVLNFFSIPFTLFSLYYQIFILNKYCYLCLSVVGLLWIEFSSFMGFFVDGIFADIDLFILPFLLVTIILFFLKRSVITRREAENIRRQTVKIKFNPSYIATLLEQQKQMPPIFDNMQVVSLGNENAEHQITIVTNPACSHCARHYFELLNIINDNPTINMTVLFAASSQNAAFVANSILNLTAMWREEALTKWFLVQKHKEWKDWVQAIHQNKITNDLASVHHRWCELYGIITTPTLFLNGRELPDIYQINDLTSICSSLRNVNAVSV